MNPCEDLAKYLRENIRGEDFGSAGMRGPLRVLTFDGANATERLDVPPNAYIVVDGDFVGGGLAYEAAGNVTLPLVAGGIYSAPIDGRLYALRDDPDGRSISAAARLYVYGDKLSAELARSLIHARQLEELRDANTALATVNASLASLLLLDGALGSERVQDSGITSSLTGLATTPTQHGADISIPAWCREIAIIATTQAIAGGTTPKLTLAAALAPDSTNFMASNDFTCTQSNTNQAGSVCALTISDRVATAPTVALNFTVTRALLMRPRGKIRLYYSWSSAPTSQTTDVNMRFIG